MEKARNFQRFKLVLEKAEEPEIKLTISLGHRKSKGIPEKNIYFCFIDYIKAFGCVNHNKRGKFLKRYDTKIHYLPPDKLVCSSRARTEHGTMDWFKIGKAAHQGCILSPCLFNLYAEYIM